MRADAIRPYVPYGIGKTAEGSGLKFETASGRNAPTARVANEEGTGGPCLLPATKRGRPRSRKRGPAPHPGAIPTRRA